MGNKVVLLGYATVAIGILILGVTLWWTAIPMSVSAGNVLSLLAPVAFTAAVVERAVEILVSPWRDGGAAALEAAVANAAAAGKTAAAQSLAVYQAQTQRYAVAISLTLGILAALGGVRTIEPFVVAGQLAKLSNQQRTFFLCVDAGLTALVVSGGADGVHSIVNAVTSFFDATADKAKAAAK